jgi:hypothetical protein
MVTGRSTLSRFSKQTRVEPGREAIIRNLLRVLQMIVQKTGLSVDQIRSLVTK